MKIVEYLPEYQPFFEEFNKDWLEEYFVVEPIDKWVLENPDEAILNSGGRILFAEDQGAIIGTVALRWTEPGILEMTKMAVKKSKRGSGAGKLLCSAAIDGARQLGAHTLILYSQTSLAAAVNLYRKLGFVEIPLEPGVYKRADIKMKMKLV